MGRKLKILFFGLGSIGSRHLRLLKKNYNHTIYAFRTKKGNPMPNVKNIYNLNEALQINPDIAFITNPTDLHVETAILCLKAGIKNIFIEKPLSDSTDNLDYFLKEVKKSNALVYIAYFMRFHPVLKRLKDIVEEKKNQIFYAQTICSSYLPSWRPGIDYRKVYSAMKDKGGGVILDLSHEFDYNEWLFGKIKSIEGIYGKISQLEIDSEDFCDVIFKFYNNMIAKIHLDYFSYNEQRVVKVLTPAEEIIADLFNKEIIIISNLIKKKEQFNFELDDVYEMQLKSFLEGVENEIKNNSNLKDSIELLKKLLEFKKNNKMLSESNILKN